ncbi:ArnT family glycosyltransferase [Streptomyces sp. NPDC059582]|uniref:ArnT family glycosyltransferase n=1 Tax=Streptomyces sp. NPDC059582 TaxID=3346875 RepID=UPI00368B8AA3
MTTQYHRTIDQGGAPATWGPPSTAAPSTAASREQAAVRAPVPEAGEPRQPLLRRLWRGRPEDPRWARPAFLGLLLATGLLYLYNLSASGYANSFYSAAVQAGSKSWKAFFFGSLDAGNAITVDKPPAALWPMELAVRVFGLGSWAILVPEVLMGVATVAVVYAGVRRRFSAASGLIAGAVLALTPVAALMFRFDNPDAMLALLMAVACYLVVRALEDGRTKWLLWAGAAIGFAFLAKTLQAFLNLPPLAIVYGVCAPVRPRRRLGQLALATLALIVSGGWWVAIVELWPASSRPYIGGSQNNSFLELTFGYNGLGRLSGDETGSVGVGGGGGGAGGTGQWGETGWDRMFNSEIGGQISWLLPAALVLLVAGLVATRRHSRTSVTRGAFLVWGGSLLMTMVVFSYMAGIFHQYYTVALAPYMAAVIGMGAGVLWEKRAEILASIGLAASAVAVAVWSYVLLDRTADYLPWLKWLVLVGGLAGALGLVFAGRVNRRLALAAVAVSVVAALAGPTAYTLSTLQEGHTGSIVTAGPAGASMLGGGGGGGRGGFGGNGGGPGGGTGGNAQGRPGNGTAQNGNSFPGGGAAGGFPGGGNARGQQGDGTTRNGTGFPGGGTGEGGGMGGGGGVGGLLNGASVSSEAEKLLETDSGEYTWVAAAIGAQNAASYQLSTGEAVMAIGGFNGTDPSPTPAQFKKYVRDGKVHYFISSGSGGGMGGSSSGTSAQITSWVESNFKKVTVGSATFYDLTQATNS